MVVRIITALALFTAAGTADAGDWLLRLQAWQSGEFELPGATAEDTERQSLRLAWAAEHGRARTGIAYEHQPLLIRTGDPATNGYLHQVDVLHARRLGRTRVDVALGVHGSSNLFTHGEIRGDALVGRFRVLHPVPGPLDAVGLAGDYRFGEFLVYPRLTASLSLGGTQLTADLPVALGWEDTGGAWRIGLERYGEHWATLDTSETTEGKLYLDEWRLTGRHRIGASNLYAGAGVSFDTRVRLLDLRRGRVQGEQDPALFAFVEWRP